MCWDLHAYLVSIGIFRIKDLTFYYTTFWVFFLSYIYTTCSSNTILITIKSCYPRFSFHVMAHLVYEVCFGQGLVNTAFGTKVEWHMSDCHHCANDDLVNVEDKITHNSMLLFSVLTDSWCDRSFPFWFRFFLGLFYVCFLLVVLSWLKLDFCWNLYLVFFLLSSSDRIFTPEAPAVFRVGGCFQQQVSDLLRWL